MSWCPLSYQSVSKAEKEARRKSKAGELLTDQESELIARYSCPIPCCSLALPSTSAHLLTSLALTDVLHFVYNSYHDGLRLEKQQRLVLDGQFMMLNPHIKLATLRSPGTTQSFSHTTFHNHTIVMK